MEMKQKNENEILSEIRSDFAKNNDILTQQLKAFSTCVAPYMTIDTSIEKLVNHNTDALLRGKSFFRIKSCTVEKFDDVFQFINTRISKFFTAIYPLNTTVIYGIISRNGKTDIVLAVDYDKKDVVYPIIAGLLTGIDIEEDKRYTFERKEGDETFGGFISAVPIIKIDDEKQELDFSTLMKCLNGKDYNFFVCAKPRYDGDKIYTDILNVKDNAFSVSKRNLSIQKSMNDSMTRTETITTNKRGVIQELANQAVREHRVDFGGLVDAFIDSGIQSKSEAVSTATTLEGLSRGESFDVQNSVATELIEYCEKAVERIKCGISTGLWDCVISYSAASKEDSDILKSCIFAELGRSVENVMPLVHHAYPASKNMVLLPTNAVTNNPLYVPITSAELGTLCTPPTTPVPDFEIRKGKLYPMIPSSDSGTVIGKVSDGQRAFDKMPFVLSEKDLNKHTFVCGITGSGKTTTVKTILRGVSQPFLVIESAKKEYRNISNVENVYTMGKPEINCIQMNPFYVQCGINLQTHIDFLKDLFNASFSFYGPMPYIIEKCLGIIYQKKGWNLTLGYHPLLINLNSTSDVFDVTYMKKQYELEASKYLFPTMYDLKEEVKRYIDKEMNYEGEVAGNIKSAIISRLESLCVGAKGFMFNTYRYIDMESLMRSRTVIELEGLADDSDKAFGVGLMIVFINEYRQVCKEIDRSEGLKHILVIEEAHRLLKNVDTEKSSESMGNPKGKAVEHFTNMIAEMRSYGQGVIIAEQIPSKLAPDVLKNSSNKIVQRIVSADDQAIIANTIGIQGDDSLHLGDMRTGYALCHKEGMSLPVLVEVEEKKDAVISDADIIASTGRSITEIFDAINEQLIVENLGKELDNMALKLLNTLMVMNDQTVAKDIRNLRITIMDNIQKCDVALLPMTNDRKEQLCGNILTGRILTMLNDGIYSIKCITPNVLKYELEDMLVRGISEKVIPVKNRLTKLYKMDCKRHCLDIIAELLKRNMTRNINISESIKTYFYSIDEQTIGEISNMTKVVMKND